MLNYNPYPIPTAQTVCSVEGLLYFVWEREVVRILRASNSQRPWTADPILSKYKFTNIRRCQDRVSNWIIEEIILPHLTDTDLWFSLLIARLINWPPTLQVLLTEGVIPCVPEYFDKQEFVEVIEHLKQRRSKVYGGAYMVYPTKMGKGGCKSSALAEYIIGGVVQAANEIRACLDTDKPSVERFVLTLSGCFGVSSFMAGQVAADLTYAPGHLYEAEDLYSYAPIGPGSSRGLNYLTGRVPYASWCQAEFNQNLIDIRFKIHDKLDISGLTLHDVQNVMCEYSKYCRTVLGQGKPKTTYKPETEF